MHRNPSHRHTVDSNNSTLYDVVLRTKREVFNTRSLLDSVATGITFFADCSYKKFNRKFSVASDTWFTVALLKPDAVYTI